MTEEVELRQTLQRIRQEASAARAFFHTWNALSTARGDTGLRATMNDHRHVDFFFTSIEGSFRLFFLRLGKIFDKSSETVIIGFLSEKLREGAFADITQEIEEITSNHDGTITKIRLVRNRVVAHNDLASTNEVFENAGIAPNQVETLIDTLCGILNNIDERVGFPDRISERNGNERAVRHLLKTLHDSRLPRTKTLRWDQVRQFLEDHGCVVTGHPESTWYREAWEALEKAGLTSTTESQEFELAQTALKLRALFLLVMYLGIYQAAGTYSELGGYFSEHPHVSSYLDSLDVKMENIWGLARESRMLEADASSYHEHEESDDELLHEIAMHFVSDENMAIFDALVEHYGGNVELFVCLWNSRMPSDEIEPFEVVVDSVRSQDGKVGVWAYVEERMVGWSWT